MSAEHGGSHGGGGEMKAVVKTISQSAEGESVFVFDILSLFIFALIAPFDGLVLASSQGTGFGGGH